MATKQKINPNTYVKIGLWIGGGLAVAFGVSKVLKILRPEYKREQNEQKTIESELESETKKTGLTYPLSQYSNFANIIETAGFDVGTDEAAIYNVFRLLKNNADYLQLTKAWGKPTRKIYDWGFGYDMTLPQYIRWEMDAKEAGRINAILKSKNIKYRV